jgi:Zn-dependent protease
MILTMLAVTDFDSPLLWAALIGWILSVVLHEFAHGIVAWWGGDWTIRERGGLTLNPLQYVDPFMSIILPAIFLLMGGLPLPGGATYIRRDLLRSRAWESAVSLAGPAMNGLIFLACALPLHPAFGWANYSAPPGQWTNGQTFLAAMATLQFTAIVLNLVPVPPLDGFGALLPWLKPDTQAKLTAPGVALMMFIGYFLILNMFDQFWLGIFRLFEGVLGVLGFDEFEVIYFRSAFLRVMYNAW